MPSLTNFFFSIQDSQPLKEHHFAQTQGRTIQLCPIFYLKSNG